MKRKARKILIIISVFVLSFFVCSNVASYIAYATLFDRVPAIDYSITPGIINYQEFSETIERNEFYYDSNGEKLTGYYYKGNDDLPLIVISSGLNDTADSLLPICIYFNVYGFNVFTYDNCGSGKSTGKQYGFYQSLVDLESTLYFLNTHSVFKDSKKLLFGYSAGGFASTSIFNITSENILASVSVSAYYNAKDMMVNKAKKYIGHLSYVGSPIINIIQNRRYSKYLSYNSINGINNVSTPILLIHAENDKTIDLNKESILSQKDNITNQNVNYMILDNHTHTSVFYTNEAIEYRNMVDKKISSIKNYKEKQEYVKTINDSLYSQINKNLFNQIITFYTNNY